MKNRLATAGLVAFLAVDIGLVALALRAGKTQPGAAPTVTRSAGLTTRPPASSSSSSTTTKAPTSPVAAKAVPAARLVSALDAATAWRASTGTCAAGGAEVELTTDGGATWTPLRTPARAVARVQPLDEARAFVVGAGVDCRLRQYSTSDAGETWQPPSTVNGGWARPLDDPTTVLAPKKAESDPCSGAVVVDLSRTSAVQAEALCADGSVVVTDDGGLTWTDSGDAPGGVALSNLLADGTLTTYAARIVGACKGVQVVNVVRGENAGVVACVPVTNAARGQVGLSVTTRAGWLVAGDQTWVSVGDLRSWKQV